MRAILSQLLFFYTDNTAQLVVFRTICALTNDIVSHKGKPDLQNLKNGE